MSNNYGILLHENEIKLHRSYFQEMVKLLGVMVIYRAPREGKTYTTYTEIDSSYYEPVVVGCIFEEHPQHKTMRKLGWDSELLDNVSLISVPYDLEKLQRGALFIIPSGIDNAKGRLFRVEELSNQMIYPASITCKLVPEYENTFESSLYSHNNNDFNLLNEG